MSRQSWVPKLKLVIYYINNEIMHSTFFVSGCIGNMLCPKPNRDELRKVKRRKGLRDATRGARENGRTGRGKRSQIYCKPNIANVFWNNPYFLNKIKTV